MDAGYPKMIAEEFPGIGNKVDAVFQKGGKWVYILLSFVATEYHQYCYLEQKIPKIFILINDFDFLIIQIKPRNHLYNIMSPLFYF